MLDHIFRLIARTNPVLLIVAGVFLGILGVLIIAYPQILVWTLGLGLLLLGVALIATVFVSPRE